MYLNKINWPSYYEMYIRNVIINHYIFKKSYVFISVENVSKQLKTNKMFRSVIKV